MDADRSSYCFTQISVFLMGFRPAYAAVVFSTVNCTGIRGSPQIPDPLPPFASGSFRALINCSCDQIREPDSVNI
jgi:hypothetical protein